MIFHFRRTKNEGARKQEPPPRGKSAHPPQMTNLGLPVAPSLFSSSSRRTQTARSAQSGIGPNSLMPLLVETEASPARLLLNLTVTWENLFGKDTEARFTGNNLTNATYPVLQPYYGDHAPLPTNDRRFTLDLVWRF